jgi:hypothetical protein
VGKSLVNRIVPRMDQAAQRLRLVHHFEPLPDRPRPPAGCRP